MKISICNIILFTGLTLCSFTAYPQNKTIDSLQKILATEKEDTNKVNTLINLCKEFDNIADFKNIMLYAKEALQLSEKLNFELGIATAYNAIGVGYLDNFNSNPNNFDSAIENISKGVVIFEKIGSKTGAARCYYLVAFIYEQQDNYTEALKNLYSALSRYEELGDKYNIALTLIRFGYVNEYQNKDTAALENYFEVLKIGKEIKDNYLLYQSYWGIVDTKMVQGTFTSLADAIRYDSITLKMGQELKIKEYVIYSYKHFGDIYGQLGELYKSKDKIAAAKFYSKARENYLIYLKLLNGASNAYEIADDYERIGSVNIRLNNLEEAKEDLLKSLKFGKEIKNKYDLEPTYESLSELDSAEGNFQQAFENYKIYIIYRDSLNNNETDKKSLQLKMQYESDKKEAVAKAIQDKKDAEAKRVRNLQYFAIASLGFLVLVIVLVAFIQWRNNKHKQKANILLQQQKEKVESTLTELKSTQAQLIQSEKMASLGELTAGIAHEIQNPLNFVNNFSDVNTELIDELEQEMNKGDIEEAKAIAKDIKENEQKINHHGKRADSIVKGMLQHSKKSTGQKEPTDINALADEYLRLSYHGMRAKDKSFNATIQTNFDKSIGAINIIPQDISRVLLNLYNNAFYAVQQKQMESLFKELTTFEKLSTLYEPTISVSTKKINNTVLLTVKDNGNGIPQKIVNKIFQPFFTTKPTGEGTGLGLSLSYDIIKAHGGELKVESKEGEGTEFIVQLPISV